MKRENSKIQEVVASGSYYEIGFTIGQETNERIIDLIGKNKKNESDTFNCQYREYLEYIKSYAYIMEEFKGMADGAGVDMEDIIKLNIVELNQPVDDCSTFIIKNSHSFILAHNEDGREGDDIFLLRATYPTGTTILSFCYYGSLVGFSANINSHGLIILCNALHANDKKIGEPKRVFARHLIECKTIESAIQKIEASQRAQGQNFTFIQNNRIVGVETSASKLGITEVSENYFHCNSYNFPEMIQYDSDIRRDECFYRNVEGKNAYQSLNSLEEARNLLSSHKNKPYCFCAHGKEGGDSLKTLGSMFIDYLSKKIWIGYGYTCSVELEHHHFNFDW